MGWTGSEGEGLVPAGTVASVRAAATSCGGAGAGADLEGPEPSVTDGTGEEGREFELMVWVLPREPLEEGQLHLVPPGGCWEAMARRENC